MTPPCQPRDRRVRLTALSDPAWRVQPSAIAFTASSRADFLLEAVLKHYDGGGTWLTRHCLCKTGSEPRPVPCAAEWFAENLYLDQTYVWSLWLQWAGRGGLRTLHELRQGWFASGNGTDNGSGNPCYARNDCMLSGQTSNYQAACPSVAPHVSSFDLFSYIAHGADPPMPRGAHHPAGRSEFHRKYSHWAGHTPQNATVWPELVLPQSTHGGWLHQRVVAREAQVQANQPIGALQRELSGCDLSLPRPSWWR